MINLHISFSEASQWPRAHILVANVFSKTLLSSIQLCLPFENIEIPRIDCSFQCGTKLPSYLETFRSH